MTEKRINFSDYIGFIAFYLIIYYLFFGFISNLGPAAELKEPGDRLLFIYWNFVTNLGMNWTGLYPPDYLWWIWYIPGWLSFFILFGIGVAQAFREDFLVYAVKNNLMMVPLIIITSWIWYSINYRANLFYVMGRYFSSYHGYINIIVIVSIYVGAGFLGGWLKTYKNRYKVITVV